MSKTDKELAAEILIAALGAGEIKTKSESGTGQGDHIASAFKRIYEAVAADLPQHP